MTAEEFAKVKYLDHLWVKARGRWDKFYVSKTDLTTGLAVGRRLDYSNLGCVHDLGDCEVDAADLFWEPT
jgi:hypothetical protein